MILSASGGGAEIGADEGASPSEAAAARLRFALHGESQASPNLDELREMVASQRVRVFEPYEGREVVFAGMPLAALLDVIYSKAWRSQQELLFTCSDGYQPTVPVRRVLEHRAWLAYDRTDEGGFSILKRESGAQRRIELGPFYLIWENLDDAQIRMEGDYGWPYQLVGVDVIRTRDRFPNTAPPDAASEQALAGYASFRVHCSRCHAINGEGGGIGPDLNRPVSAVVLRDEEWLRRWIENPGAIRQDSRMPRLNPDLPDRAAVIESIIAYLEAMSGYPGRETAEVRDGS